MKFKTPKKYFKAKPVFDFVKKNKIKVMIVQGPRGNGKTWNVCRQSWNLNEPMVYVRRLAEEGTKKSPASAYAWSGGSYLTQGTFELKFQDGKNKTKKINIPTTINPETGKVVCFYVNLSTAEHLASVSIFDDVKNIIFDEFTSRDNKYLSNEPKKLMNLVATIERNRDNVTLWLISNYNDVLNPHQDWLNLPLTKDQPKNVPFMVNEKMKIGAIYLTYTADQKKDLKNTIYGNILKLTGDFEQQTEGIYTTTIPYVHISAVKNLKTNFVFACDGILHQVVVKNGIMVASLLQNKNLKPTLALTKRDAFLFKIEFDEKEIDNFINEEIPEYNMKSKFFFASYSTYECLLPFLSKQKNEPELVVF